MSMQSSFFMNNIKNLCQFVEKNISPKMGLIYKSFFAQKYYQSFIIHWSDAWKEDKNSWK